MYWNDVQKHVGSERLAQFWLANDDIRAYVNHSISGSPHRWPFDWFRREFSSHLPLENCAVVGCGTGALERYLVREQVVREVTAIDVAPAAVAFAAEEARLEGVDHAIHYEVTDAIGFLARNEARFDGIFFHGALHHLSPVNEVLRLAKGALTPRGILYLDEYVGPSMHQWRWWRLATANVAYYLAASRTVRRPRLVRAPRNADDPTEMIDAASIVPSVRQHFRILAERGYGGNILAIVYPNLRHDAAPQQLRNAVRRLVAIERQILRIAGHHHAVIVASRS